MSRTPLPLTVGDISMFAHSLRRQLNGRENTPGHVEMLNLLCKAGGFRNFQHFKSQQERLQVQETPPTAQIDVNDKKIQRVARFFDHQGRLVRWPGKFSQCLLCLWVMWSRIPARTSLHEREISVFLDSHHLFGDHALLRRELVDRGMVERTPDGRQYRRIERTPPAEALALFEKLRRVPENSQESNRQ
ncbi:MAG: DUF2087 domain-containing protein [Deltaproteobacteria bacterium]|nr:DUF2087 domain-containing protein [Deltaproteobacteria bacterium]